MTLIAAFRSEIGNPKGIALCADSQETATTTDTQGNPYEVKVSVQKLEPIRAGDVSAIIAGSGNATLIDGFIEHAKRALEKHAVGSLSALKDLLEQTLARYYKKDVKFCTDSDKTMKLFIGASCPTTREHELWLSSLSTLRKCPTPSLIGWVEGLYDATAKRMSGKLTLQQAVLASIYTVTIAKQTSNYVSGDLSVAVIGGSGIQMESKQYISEMETRLAAYETQVNRVFLSCADTSISVTDLGNQLKDFSESALAIHRQQIDLYFSLATPESLAQTNDIYPKAPLGYGVVFDAQGKLQEVIHTDERQLESDEAARRAANFFMSKGLIEYAAKRISQDEYEIAISGRWSGEYRKLTVVNEAKMAEVLANTQQPYGIKWMALLGADGNEITFWGMPVPEN